MNWIEVGHNSRVLVDLDKAKEIYLMDLGDLDYMVAITFCGDEESTDYPITMEEWEKLKWGLTSSGWKAEMNQETKEELYSLMLEAKKASKLP